MTSPPVPQPPQLPEHDHRQERVLEMQAKFSGPLPLPAHLEQYDRIVPGAAERIIKMAESQSIHRRELEGWVVRTNSITSVLGQLFGVYIALQAFKFAAEALTKGYSGKAIAVVLVTIGTLAGVFVYGKHTTAKERRARKEPNKGSE